MARKSLEAQIQQSTSAKALKKATKLTSWSQVSWTLVCDHHPRHQGWSHPNQRHWQLLHQRCHLEETLPAKSGRCHWLLGRGPGLRGVLENAQDGEGARTIHLGRCYRRMEVGRKLRDTTASTVDSPCLHLQGHIEPHEKKTSPHQNCSDVGAKAMGWSPLFLHRSQDDSNAAPSTCSWVTDVTGHWEQRG